MSPRNAYVLAILIILIWAAFWVYFVLAATWGEPGTLLQKLLATAIGLTIVLGSTVAPLANPRVGGAVLLVEGILLAVANYAFLHNPPATRAFLFFTLALPPIVAGALALAAGFRPHRAGP